MYRYYKPWLWHKSALYLMPSGRKYRKMIKENYNFVKNVSLFYIELGVNFFFSFKVNTANVLYMYIYISIHDKLLKCVVVIKI